MKISFEHNFQKKVMIQTFTEHVVLASEKDVTAWRNLWMPELKSWHSPYKTLIDCSNLLVRTDDEKVKPALDRLLKFFEGFFLKKAVGFGYNQQAGHDLLPFKVHSDENEALTEVGLAKGSLRPAGGDFRSAIQLQNHFRQHCVELTFAEETTIDTLDKLAILRSKLTNNLMQWHSKWNLLIDCHNLRLSPDLNDEFLKMEKFFKGLFLKQIVGYNNLSRADFPFDSYRARHKAAAVLEGEGNFSGDEAECKSGVRKG